MVDFVSAKSNVDLKFDKQILCVTYCPEESIVCFLLSRHSSPLFSVTFVIPGDIVFDL